MSSGRPVVAVGAHVRFRGLRWQVVALAGQRVHLTGEEGSDETVLAGHLFADEGFAVLGAQAEVEQPEAVPRWGLFETAPAAAREKALAWQRHVREVECGLPGGPGSGGVVRPQYDPERHTLAERERAKAEELTRARLRPGVAYDGAAHAPGLRQTRAVGARRPPDDPRPQPFRAAGREGGRRGQRRAAQAAGPLQGHRQRADATGRAGPSGPVRR
ncbi:hypothetical protein GCM10010507_60550 [Streptomyces cinnamoneus]|uniref:Uncharacterized protein n=1 Tax=Streptomyces cinnamoneus TaxID=53446 RepID=A0A918TZ81_STRCJ|nr:hypothetical protein GCM10010507_60550 [Streptomyces cinnamoneus]